MKNFAQFHERFSLRYNNKLKAICNPLFKAFDITSFFYKEINGRYFSTICTDIDLQNYYFDEKKIYKNNPFIMNPCQLNSGLYFDEAVENKKFLTTEQSLETKFGVKYCYRIIKKAAASCKQFGFGKHPEMKRNDLLFINQLPLINKFISHFQNEMNDTIKEMDQYALDLKQDMDATDAVKSGIPDIECDQSKNYF